MGRWRKVGGKLAGRWWQDGGEGGGEVVGRQKEGGLKVNAGVVGKFWEEP